MRVELPCVNCEVDAGVVTLGFADDLLNTSRYLLLQRTVSGDEHNHALDDDRVYVEFNSQMHCAYGRIEQAYLDASHLRIVFDEQTATQVCNGEALEITFQLLMITVAMIADCLRLLSDPGNVHFSA